MRRRGRPQSAGEADNGGRPLLYPANKRRFVNETLASCVLARSRVITVSATQLLLINLQQFRFLNSVSFAKMFVTQRFLHTCLKEADSLQKKKTPVQVDDCLKAKVYLDFDHFVS